MDISYYSWVQIQKNWLNSTRSAVQIKDLDSAWVPDSPEYGITWQFFTDKIHSYYQEHGKCGGYVGESYSPFLPIDIDDIETDPADIIKQLYDLGVEDFNFYFSGRKGYHIEIPSSLLGVEPCDNLPGRYKYVASQLDIEADTSLYKRNQLYRLPNTLNSKSQLYKIQLNPDDILGGMTLGDIQELAREPQEESFQIENMLRFLNKDKPTGVNEYLSELWDKSRTQFNTKTPNVAGVKKGKRNSTAYDTALRLKTQGKSIVEAESTIIKMNEENDPPDDVNQQLATVRSAYNGPYYKSFPINPVLQHLKEDYWKNLNDYQKIVYVKMLYSLNVRGATYQSRQIERNQFVYGKLSTANRWNIDPEKLNKTILKFEKDKRIRREVIKSGGKHLYTIITLLVFDVSDF